MSSISQRFTKGGGALLGIAAAVLAGCALTGGGGAHRVAVDPPRAGFVACSGGHASRFPEQEKVGSVCRQVTSVYVRY